ncbi:hypothetical protein MIR68_000072 [Amoeboaphelidium protococcarum]|nr:hypothetical protein MIR68_011814 [Amoeboaphelidium protococcarum]KAI3636910.1 hypothetical protein MIR68_005177 [Amoeboaphelidium protococcarum]KAI3641431.1 hypothetical protein MIR68_000561 [Amoeboaphelidium protococcarum]KAI3641892.1 hypothetical protein MIR68_000072 [Amoeboaphelidium protococcarum]
MVMSDTDTMRVLFNGSNFRSWLRYVMMLLRKEECDAAVEREFYKKIQNLPSLSHLYLKELELAEVKQKRQSRVAKLQNQLLIMNSKAVGIIQSTVKEDLKIHISSQKFAYKCIKVIKNLFNQKSIENINLLNAKINNLQFDTVSAITFVLKMEDLQRDLRECGDKSITSESLALKCLNKLPKQRYGELVKSVRTYYALNTKKRLTCKRLKKLLTNFEVSEQQDKESSERGEEAVATQSVEVVNSVPHSVQSDLVAMFSKGLGELTGSIKALMTRDGKSGEKRSRKDNEVFCSNCKRYGNHVEDECWNLEKNKARRPSWFDSIRGRDKRVKQE